MFGMRTPAQTSKATDESIPKRLGGNPSLNSTFTKTSPKKTSPSPVAKSTVRRSIGEWEKQEMSKKTQPKPQTPPKAPNAPSTSAVTAASPATVEPPKPKDRVTEARNCLIKIKTQLGQSRNTKTEIKAEITLAAEKLYQLVKEAEAGNGRNLSGKMSGKTTEAENPPTLPSSLPCPVQGDGERGAVESETTSIRSLLEEHSKKLAESNEKMDRLKEALRISQDSMENMSYASAAASQPERPPPRQTALHSIAVTTEDVMETGEGVLNKIRKAVNAKEEWIKVERVRKAKNSKVIMSFETKKDRDKVKERLKKNGTDLTVEEVKNRDPLLILRDVLSVNTDEDVLKAFRNQNPGVFHGLDDEADRIEIKYRKRARNPHTGHIVFSASPSIWQRVTEKGHVYIDLQRVRAEDQSPLVQCSLCLGYGHSRRHCTDTTERCSHCGGMHLKKDCAEWRIDSVPTCCNCTHAKLDKTDHNAFSRDCAVRKKWDEIARTAYAYC